MHTSLCVRRAIGIALIVSSFFIGSMLFVGVAKADTPTVISVTTRDSDLDGSIDSAEIVFSGPMTLPTPGDFSVGSSTVTSVTASSTNPNAYVFSFAPIVGTDAKSVAYLSGSAVDGESDPLAAFSRASMDGASPILMSAHVVDATHVEADFSENVKSSTINSSGNEFVVSGYAVSHAAEPTPGAVLLTVATTSAGATPQVSYISNGPFTDLAGNQSPSPQTVIATNAIVVDTPAPTLTSVHLSSNNAQDPTQWAKAGDTVTLAFTPSTDIQTPLVTIAGGSADSVAKQQNGSWVASKIIAADSSQGPLAFSISFQDLSGKAGTAVTSTTDASGIVVDSVAPQISIGTNPEVIGSGTSSHTASAQDSGSGVSSYAWTEVSGPGVVTFAPADAPQTTMSVSADGVYKVRLTALDAAGNSASSDLTVVHGLVGIVLDIVPPAAPVITTASTTVDATEYAITGTEEDDGDVRTVLLYNNGTLVATTSLEAGVTEWQFTVPLTPSAENVFVATAADSSGNVSASSTPVSITEAPTPDVPSLSISEIGAERVAALPDDVFSDGWSWTFHVSVPRKETQLSLKLSDFVGDRGTIAAPGNVRYFSPQSSAHADDAHAVSIETANAYPLAITLDGDSDPDSPGRQVDITVQMKVPAGTHSGSYSASYGLRTDPVI